MTREQALDNAIRDALAHHRASTSFASGAATTEKHLQGLYAGLRIVREKMTADRLRSNDLTQLIACALDCLAAGYYDAAERGEEPTLPPPEDRSS